MIGTRGDLRLGGHQVQERRHGRLGVEHALVHVDVDDVGAAAHLLGGDVERLRVVAGLDQLGELACEPVTLVRSPIIMEVASPAGSSSGSRPLKRA